MKLYGQITQVDGIEFGSVPVKLQWDRENDHREPLKFYTHWNDDYVDTKTHRLHWNGGWKLFADVPFQCPSMLEYLREKSAWKPKAQVHVDVDVTESAEAPGIDWISCLAGAGALRSLLTGEVDSTAHLYAFGPTADEIRAPFEDNRGNSDLAEHIEETIKNSTNQTDADWPPKTDDDSADVDGVRFETDGTIAGTRITSRGKPIESVEAARLEFDANDGLARLHLDILAPDVDAELDEGTLEVAYDVIHDRRIEFTTLLEEGDRGIAAAYCEARGELHVRRWTGTTARWRAYNAPRPVYSDVMAADDPSDLLEDIRRRYSYRVVE